MPDIRRILCPVDFSPHAENALEFALDLAERFGADVHVAHAYQMPIYAVPDGALTAGPEFASRVTAELAKALQALVDRHPRGRVQTHLVEGVAYKEIVRLSDDLAADLVVIGTHGRTGLKHLLLGSVAERVVRASAIPVITVPTHEEE